MFLIILTTPYLRNKNNIPPNDKAIVKKDNLKFLIDILCI